MHQSVDFSIWLEDKDSKDKLNFDRELLFCLPQSKQEGSNRLLNGGDDKDHQY
jgi:hypothetical protein